MSCCTGGRHCRRAFMIMMASAIAIAAVGSVLMTAFDDIDAAGEMSGTCGDDLTWTIDSDGNLVIEGTGPMYDFEPGEKRWGGNTVVTVTIGDSVTTVGAYAFLTGIHIVSAVIGDSVLSIGSCAFFECWALESVSMGKSVTSIGENAFWFCSFKSIDLPDTLESIGGEAFFECGSLESVAIPDSVTEIGSAPFDRCTSLKSITVGSGNTAYCSSDGVLFDKEKTRLIQYPPAKEDRSYSIPDSVRSIEIDAFNKSGNLEQVSIPRSVASIGVRAFANCGSLASVTIPDSVTEIEESAFGECSSLKSVTIPGSIAKIEKFMFVNCSALESVVIPDSVTEIAGYAFGSCASLLSVDLPSRMTKIEASVFYGCSSLKSVVIPDSVTEIGNSAFFGCYSLESVVIPDSVTTIGTSAFMDCHGLLKIGFGSGVTSMKNAFRGHVFYDSDGTTVLGDDASDYAGSCFVGASEDKMVRSDWPSVTVTFDANGGQCSVGSVKTEDGRIVSIPVPTRDGYSFDGWSSSASGGAGVTESTLFVEDATVYAQWKEDSGKDSNYLAYSVVIVIIIAIVAGAAMYKRTR